MVRIAALCLLLVGCHKLFDLESVDLPVDGAPGDDGGDGGAIPSCYTEPFNALDDLLVFWDVSNEPGCGVTVEADALVITLPSTPCYAMLRSNTRLAFPVGSTMSVRPVALTPDDFVDQFLRIGVDDDNFYIIHKSEAYLVMFARMGGQDITPEALDYAPQSFAHWRIERSATEILFRTSVNGMDWTTRHSALSTLVPLDNLEIHLGAGVYANLATTDPVTGSFDDFTLCRP